MSDIFSFPFSTPARKQCWSCDATTPYDQGWCEDCCAAMPPGVLTIVNLTSALEPEFGGAIRQAVSGVLRFRRTSPGTVLNLDDLEV